MAHVESVFPPDAPVSRALERELRAKLNSGGLQVWLDKDAYYSAFVARLREAANEGAFDPVVTYGGSFLEMLGELEGKTAQATQCPMLLIHLPGFNDDEVRHTPVLTYYLAGKQYQRKLETLVENAASGLVDPDAIQHYIENDLSTLEAADLWLADRLSEQGDQLKALDLIEIWERLAGFKDREALGEDPESIRTHLRVRVAMDTTWLAETGLDRLFESFEAHPDRQFEILGDTLLSWAMAVEFVNDLQREPVTELLADLPDLNTTYVEACLELMDRVRANPSYEAAYIRVANDFADKLSHEVEHASAQDLGKIDTFLFEDDLIMTESLERLTEGNTEPVLAWAERRRPERSVWLRADRGRARVWTLIRAAARLDDALNRHRAGLHGVYTLDAALDRYRDTLWEVDQIHRRLEQKRRLFLSAGMPRFARVREMLDTVRERYHAWGNASAEGFTSLCVKDGFLPSADRQQRSLFEQVVRPRVNDSVDRLGLVLLDGFRFEMAHELLERLEAGDIEHRLDARLAELPSITSVGMNLLAPVADSGRLSPVIKSQGNAHKLKGFQLGSFRVRDPESRRRAMAERVGGAKCPLMSLDEVLTSPNLKGSLQGFGLAVIHSLDLDEVGEVGHGTAAFDTILMRVASAIRQLREAGVKRFVITSDHGFLLEPPRETLDLSGSVAARYRFDEHGVSSVDEVSTPLSDLGFGDTSLHVVFPKTLSCYQVSGGPRNFVHGGNSLQERVIPVLTLDYRGESGGVAGSFEILAERVEVPGGQTNRVSLKLRGEQGTLAFVSSDRIELTFEPVEEGLELEVTHIGPTGDLASESSVYVEPGGHYDIEFVIRGSSDSRTPVLISSTSRHEQIEPLTPEEFFEVTGSASPAAQPGAAAGQAAPESNWMAIEDEKARGVLKHVATHGSVTEAEATRMLGGARQFRRFSRQINQWQRFLSFNVRVEPSAAGKRYVKE